MIIPLTRLLLKATSTGPDIPLRHLLVQEMTKRFFQVEHRFTTAVATLLDPLFKKLAFADSSAVDHAVRRLTSEVATLITNNPATSVPPQDDHEEEVLTAQSAANSLWATFDEKVMRATSHRSDGTDACLEVKRYFEIKNIERKNDPLSWWKENGTQFPHLMQVASKYLAIPGSSVPSEQLSSKAGELISQRRSQIKPENVDMILFLNKNLSN